MKLIDIKKNRGKMLYKHWWNIFPITIRQGWKIHLFMCLEFSSHTIVWKMYFFSSFTYTDARDKSLWWKVFCVLLVGVSFCWGKLVDSGDSWVSRKFLIQQNLTKLGKINFLKDSDAISEPSLNPQTCFLLQKNNILCNKIVFRISIWLKCIVFRT